jgi:hypothetical protein
MLLVRHYPEHPECRYSFPISGNVLNFPSALRVITRNFAGHSELSSKDSTVNKNISVEAS